jgi:ribonuclease HI
MIKIYTDGACRKNPGPGGFAAVIVMPDGRREELGGHDPRTTNNRMELAAAIAALRRVPAPKPVTVHSDSEYVVKGMTTWLAGWKKRGWRTRGGDEVLNRDLWETLDLLAAGRAGFEHVRGHAGDELNERCDALARAFAAGTHDGSRGRPG